MRGRGWRGGVAMTVIRSASGVRIDCDGCREHAASPGLSIEVLRRATGYVQHGDRDWCPDCWRQRAASRLPASGPRRDDSGPAAA